MKYALLILCFVGTFVNATIIISEADLPPKQQTMLLGIPLFIVALGLGLITFVGLVATIVVILFPDDSDEDALAVAQSQLVGKEWEIRTIRFSREEGVWYLHFLLALTNGTDTFFMEVDDQHKNAATYFSLKEGQKIRFTISELNLNPDSYAQASCFLIPQV